MRNEILNHARRVSESCFLPPIRALWQDAVESYEAGDNAPLAYLILQELKAMQMICEMHGWKITDFPEAEQLIIMLEFLGFHDPDTSTIKGFWEYE